MDYTLEHTDPLKNSLVVNELSINGPRQPYFPSPYRRTDGVATFGGETSLVYAGKAVPDYGDFVQSNFLHLLEHFASPVPPAFPNEGQLWYKNDATPLVTNANTPQQRGMYVCRAQIVRLDVTVNPDDLITSFTLSSRLRGAGSVVEISSSTLFNALTGSTIAPASPGAGDTTSGTYGTQQVTFDPPLDPTATPGTLFSGTYTIDINVNGIAQTLNVVWDSARPLNYVQLFQAITAGLDQWAQLYVMDQPLATTLDMNGNPIINVGMRPVPAATDVPNIGFADARYFKMDAVTSGANSVISNNFELDGAYAATLNKLHAAFTNSIDIVNKGYVDTETAKYLPLTGGEVTGDLIIGPLASFTIMPAFDPLTDLISVGARRILDVGVPTQSADAARLQDVEDAKTEIYAYVQNELANLPTPAGDGVVIGGTITTEGILTLERSAGIGDVTINGSFANVEHTHTSAEVFVPVEDAAEQMSVLSLYINTNVEDSPSLTRVIGALDQLLAQASRPARSQIIEADGATSTFLMREGMEYVVGVDELEVFRNGVKQYVTPRSRAMVKFVGYQGITSEFLGTSGYLDINLSAPVTASTPTGIVINPDPDADPYETPLLIDGSPYPFLALGGDIQTYGDLISRFNSTVGALAQLTLLNPTTLRITSNTTGLLSSVVLQASPTEIFQQLPEFASFGEGTYDISLDAPVAGTDLTLIPDDGTTFTTVIALNGVDQTPFSVVGSDVITYNDLISQFNTQLSGVASLALVTPTTLRITTTSTSQVFISSAQTDEVFQQISTFVDFVPPDNGTETPTVDVPAAGVYGFDITVGATSYAVDISVDPESTNYRDLVVDIQAQLESLGVPASVYPEQFLDKMYFTFVANAQGAGQTIAISNTTHPTNYLFDVSVMPTLSLPITYENVTASYAITLGTGFGGTSSQFTVTPTPSLGDVIEVTIR